MTGQIPSRHGVHDYLTGVEVGAQAPDYLAGQQIFTDVLAGERLPAGPVRQMAFGRQRRPAQGLCALVRAGGRRQPLHGRHHVPQRRTRGNHHLPDGCHHRWTRSDSWTGRPAGPEPFFLAVNYTAPHKPWKGQHPKEFEDLYADCAFESCPQEEPHPWQPTLDGVAIGGEPDVRAALVGYFAAVSAMDAAIGRIMDQLERLGHPGEHPCHFQQRQRLQRRPPRRVGQGQRHLPAKHVRLLRQSARHLPLAGPHSARPGAGSELLSAYDVAATILELAGLDPAPFETGPGASFARCWLRTAPACGGGNRPGPGRRGGVRRVRACPDDPHAGAQVRAPLSARPP